MQFDSRGHNNDGDRVWFGLSIFYNNIIVIRCHKIGRTDGLLQSVIMYFPVGWMSTVTGKVRETQILLTL